jgi:hypothetical protein
VLNLEYGELIPLEVETICHTIQGIKQNSKESTYVD